MGFGIEDLVKFWCEFVGGGFGLGLVCAGYFWIFLFPFFLNWEGERSVCGFCVWKFCGFGFGGEGPR